MYPPWVNQLFECIGCMKCSKILRPENILSIAVERDHVKAFIPMPMVRIHAQCPRCNCLHQITDERTVEDIRAAIEAQCNRKYEDDSTSCSVPGITPPFPSPNFPNDDDEPLLAFQGTPRQLMKPEGPPRAISDEDEAQFKRLLKRTSFRRRSRSYWKFMYRLGVFPENN